MLEGQIKLDYTGILPSRWGWMLCLKCDTHQSASILAYGEWAPDEVGVCLDMLKPGQVAVDVGANIGSFALPFARRVGPGGLVLAFEPQRLPLYCLTGNLVANSVAEWAHALRIALSDHAGTVKVPSIDPKHVTNVGGARMDDDKNIAGIKTANPPDIVECRTLDSFELSRCHLLKIDVEGMESKVLAGAADTVARHKPKIFAEALPWETENLEAMQAFFKAHDYVAWSITSPLFNPNNSRLCEFNAFGAQSDVNVIAVHKDQQPPAITQQLVEFETDYE